MPISTVWILKYVQQCYAKWFWTISSLGAPLNMNAGGKVVAFVWFSSLPIRKELTLLPLCCRKTTWNWWFCIHYTSFPDEIERMIWAGDLGLIDFVHFPNKIEQISLICSICSISHKTSTFDFMRLPKSIWFNRTMKLNSVWLHSIEILYGCVRLDMSGVRKSSIGYVGRRYS